MELIGSIACGSAIVEMALALTGLPYRVTDIPYLQPGPERERLLALNPLGQVPVLVLPDGQVMTESAAMMLLLDGLAPQAGLVPASGDADRPRFLTTLILLVSAVYPTFTYGDEPERWTTPGEGAAMLRTRTDEARQAMLRRLEHTLDWRPFALGDRLSALDLYMAALTHWRPKRGWFLEHTPLLVGAARACTEHPALGPVLRRHWPGG